MMKIGYMMKILRPARPPPTAQARRGGAGGSGPVRRTDMWTDLAPGRSGGGGRGRRVGEDGLEAVDERLSSTRLKSARRPPAPSVMSPAPRVAPPAPPAPRRRAPRAWSVISEA
eukprot:tig00001718_g9588.t1